MIKFIAVIYLGRCVDMIYFGFMSNMVYLYHTVLESYELQFILCI